LGGNQGLPYRRRVVGVGKRIVVTLEISRKKNVGSKWPDREK